MSSVTNGFSFKRRTFLAGASLVAATAAMGVPRAHGQEALLTVGRGMADMTGEPLGAGMNGYAVMEQSTTGIRFRQFARAFIFEDDGGESTVLVIAEMGLMFQSIQLEVLRRLRGMFGGKYDESNVFITATHTHVGPGGTSGHLMVDLTTMGFRPVTFEATVAGIVQAIERAHADKQPSNLRLVRGEVKDAGANRSFQAFSRNPAEETQQFPNGVNPESLTLFVSRGGQDVGLINWYGLHATSFGHKHTLIDGDHKGWSSWRMEKERGTIHRDAENPPFIAAFAAAPQGDVTPNAGLKPKSGPGYEDEAKSAQILGDRQIAATEGQLVDISGENRVRNRHKWVDMRDITIKGEFTPDGTEQKTGPAILGAAFAASSQEDGGGLEVPIFNEGERGGTPWVKALNNVTVPDSWNEIHGNKEMLLPLGYIDGMIQQVVMYSVTQIAGLTIITNSMEPTSMAGYRMRKHVAEILDVPLETVVCQGYTSGYAHYVTTPEEYDNQDYEGGATIFGRHQLCAMTQVYDELARSLRDNKPLDSGEPAGDLTGLIPESLIGKPMTDRPAFGQKFGDVITATRQVKAGDTASVTFAFANPNSDLRRGVGYHTITNAAGEIVADDFDSNTIIEFVKTAAVTNARISWNTEGISPGTYTVKVEGKARDISGKLSVIEGSAEVSVV
ncbi:neutral/alkaline non-lysosomal ceramidase N-terminal domain-containing protein [uncultured Corynebacterium sp.]|uniref:neutral/alkaline non-lysosomal ceramidase N-terminal domain-containing protein n=1 Tax=uncultured Corynebacterium sp. TaxID=159447 RepID=UPI0026354646|nr:neutral/alkaline non-lysosomal ceramidase N-terminal domain-containing protein [uncultured Corynebacterium sp.]